MNETPTITVLVVDDDPGHLASLRDVVTQAGYRAVAATDGAEALELLAQTPCDLVLTDLRMRNVDGLKLLAAVHERNRDLPVIVMTAFSEPETAMEAIRNGAFDYLSKPFKLDHLRLVIGRALEQSRLLKENQQLRKLVSKQHPFPEPGETSFSVDLTQTTRSGRRKNDVIGNSPEMVEIYKLVAKVAPLPTTVLIQGESGTGKEVVARLIHKNSERKGPLLAVNCGALSEGLLESELFGHVKGAFTGAVGSKTGIFAAAHDGTCFLDEISNMPATLQMKLLRVLENREVTPVGSTETVQVNARVIAATNLPLEELVKSGHFREDLLYRLKVVTISLPPLRDRRSDISLFLDYFVHYFAQAAGKEVAVHDSLYAILGAYDWPGNVRELSNSVERAIALNSSGILTAQDFPEQTRTTVPGQRPSAAWPTLEEKERQYILDVLKATENNVTRAAEILNIDRRTLTRILQRAEGGAEK